MKGKRTTGPGAGEGSISQKAPTASAAAAKPTSTNRAVAGLGSCGLRTNGASGIGERGLDIDPCVGNARVAIARLLLETTPEQLPYTRMQILRQLAPVGLCTEHVGKNVGDRLAAEERQPGKHFVKHDAERPNVGALIRRLAARLLRAHVTGRAEDEALLRHRDAQGR